MSKNGRSERLDPTSTRNRMWSPAGGYNRDDTRLLGIALALCLGVFGLVIVSLVLPAAGGWGLLIALGMLIVVSGASWLMARLILNCEFRTPRRADKAGADAGVGSARRDRMRHPG